MKINVRSVTKNEPAYIMRVEDPDNLLPMMNGVCLCCSQGTCFVIVTHERTLTMLSGYFHCFELF